MLSFSSQSHDNQSVHTLLYMKAVKTQKYISTASVRSEGVSAGELGGPLPVFFADRLQQRLLQLHK